MIVEERMIAFINSLDTGNGTRLDEIEKEAVRDRVPIIRKEMQSFLKTLLTIKQPEQILEVGTAVGFSTLLMQSAVSPSARITTIENYEKRIPIARRNFERAGDPERIQLLEGDAREVLQSLTQTYDFIFMDAAKGQYIVWLPQILRLLKPGGILVSDNVLQDGDLVESHFAVERRNRTIYKRMREYLYEIKHHPQLQTSIVPIGDGAAVSVKKEE